MNPFPQSKQTCGACIFGMTESSQSARICWTKCAGTGDETFAAGT